MGESSVTWLQILGPRDCTIIRHVSRTMFSAKVKFRERNAEKVRFDSVLSRFTNVRTTIQMYSCALVITFLVIITISPSKPFVFNPHQGYKTLDARAGAFLFPPTQSTSTRGAFHLPPSQSTSTPSPSTQLFGLFDGFGDALKDTFGSAFTNAEYSAPPEGVKASARHILVKDLELCKKVEQELAGGLTWAEAAKEYSTCPSKAQGGSLGSFSPGTMGKIIILVFRKFVLHKTCTNAHSTVPEFDAVIFNPDEFEGTVLGPVKTGFGYHLIVIDKRTGV